jgi:uncharacterized protein YlxW (UPF0749 family)
MARSVTDPAASMALLRDLMRDDAGLEYAEAARHRAERAAGDDGSGEGPDVGPQRRTSWAFVATVVVVAAVLAIGLVQRRADEPASQATRDALVARAEAAEARVSALEASVAATRAELAELQEAALADSVQGEIVSERIARLSDTTGYTAVVGGGAVVSLDDAAGTDRSDPSAPGRVLDSDVQTAVNGLWQAGAEAIAINGRRLTATTAIRTAGSAILVDFKPLIPPYRIEAIGDPATLATAYAATRSARDLAKLADEYGLRVVTTAADQLELPAATAILPTRARVPTGGGATVSPSASSPSTGGAS